ncbi:MAG: YdcF family protein [Vicinamibacterales bacterium]
MIQRGAAWSLLLLAVLLFTPVTEWMARPLYLPPSSKAERADAIVVLEAWATAEGEINEAGINRVLRGSEWYRAGVAPVVVVSGRRSTSQRPNSALAPMVRLLADLDVPRQAIEIEDQSTNTHDSAVHVAAMARARGWTKIVLVTDFAHMLRASRTFRHAGIADIARAPAMWWELGAAQPSIRFKRIALLGHEYGGIAYYWWRGWL